MDTFTILKTKLRHMRDRGLRPGAIRSRNLKRFRNLVAFVNERSPYYRDIIAGRRIDPANCSPTDFPVTTKRDVIAHFDDIVTDRRITWDAVSDFVASSKDPMELFQDRFYVLHGSGTSGEIGLFVYSKKDFSRGMAHGMGLVTYRLGKRRKRIAFLGSTDGHYAGVTMTALSMRPPATLLFNTRVFELNRSLNDIVDEMNRFQPDIVVAYATALKMLAEQQAEGALRLCPSLVESCGEPISSASKKFIESVFRCDVLNVYATTEFLYMGISRPEYGGMYLMENDLIFEFHDDHTRVTSLFNRTLPLIRFRMEDILVPIPDRHRLLPFTKVREVVARREDTMVLTNRHGRDDFIDPHAIYQFFIKDLHRFQLQQVDKQSFRFKAVLKGDIGERRREAVLREIRSKTDAILAAKDMENVSYDIEESPALPIDEKTGKFRWVVRG